MNLWFRLFAYLLTHWSKPRITTTRAWSIVRFRVWPSDIDFNLHMTNGRYLSVADFGRIDLIVRSGLFKAAMRHRWAPIVSHSAVSFRKELRLWRAFRLETRLCYWNGSVSVFEHRFRLAGGDIAAVSFSAAGFYDRSTRSFVPVDRMLAEVGVAETSPEAPPEVEAFLAAQRALKRSAMWESFDDQSTEPGA